MIEALLQLQEAAVIRAAKYIGHGKVAQAVHFADRLGLQIVNYDPVADLWHLSDGEAYSTQAVVEENVKEWDDSI